MYNTFENNFKLVFLFFYFHPHFYRMGGGGGLLAYIRCMGIIDKISS